MRLRSGTDSKLRTNFSVPQDSEVSVLHIPSSNRTVFTLPVQKPYPIAFENKIVRTPKKIKKLSLILAAFRFYSLEISLLLAGTTALVVTT